jgi:hypothetical protein
MTRTTYSMTALSLHAEGLQTLPATGKAVYLKGWPEYGKETKPLGVFADLAAMYPRNNTALILGPVCPLLAIDIDIEDRAGADAMAAVAAEVLGETPLVRRGKAGKLMLFYRKSDPVAVFPEVRQQPVEVFCNSGLVVLFGRHPSGCDYRWPVGVPMGIDWETVPVVDPLLLGRFIARCPVVLPKRRAGHGGGRVRADSMVVALDEQSQADLWRIGVLKELREQYGADWADARLRVLDLLDAEQARRFGSGTVEGRR